MSLVTKTLHRQNYAAIDAASPAQSQAGRTTLISGGTGTIGRAAAQAFVTAGAHTVVITSRDEGKAKRIAAEVEAEGKGTKVRGYQMELTDVESVKGLWEGLKRDGVEVDTLVLNATDLVPPVPEDDKLLTMWKAFEGGIRNQLIQVDAFRAQGPELGKVLLYISTNSTHMHQLPLHYTAASSPRIAMNRLMSDLAMNTPVEKMQILSIHPGFVLTEENKKHGFTADAFAPVKLDDVSLTANFYVWATTKAAAFLHGRFVWSTWDVEELAEMKPKLEADPGFLRMGLQGAASQDFGMLLQGMGRAV